MDIDTLLHALPSASPAGEDMSFSTEFDAIQALRRQDDPTLSQGEWVTDLKTADWPGVARLCEQLLATRTRDLRVAAWLTEAQAHLQGYAGLVDGLGLVTRLCAEHWPHLHPLPEDGEYELRIGSLVWLLAQVVTLARAMPVLQLAGASISLRDMDAARLLQQALERGGDGPPPATEGKLTMDQVARALRETPAVQVALARDAARQLHAGLVQLQGVVDGHLGADGPGFAAAKQAAEDAVDALERLAREVGADAGSAAPTTATAGTPAPGVVADASGPLANRAQALAQLRQVADFFRRTEPHSPVAYLADKAARWGEMPLHAWLRAVMKDPGALSQLEDLLGVEPPASH